MRARSAGACFGAALAGVLLHCGEYGSADGTQVEAGAEGGNAADATQPSDATQATDATADVPAAFCATRGGAAFCADFDHGGAVDDGWNLLFGADASTACSPRA